MAAAGDDPWLSPYPPAAPRDPGTRALGPDRWARTPLGRRRYLVTLALWIIAPEPPGSRARTAQARQGPAPDLARPGGRSMRGGGGLAEGVERGLREGGAPREVCSGRLSRRLEVGLLATCLCGKHCPLRVSPLSGCFMGVKGKGPREARGWGTVSRLRPRAFDSCERKPQGELLREARRRWPPRGGGSNAR